MAAPAAFGGGDEPRCEKISVGGEWRCNLVATSGSPFCEKHYSLEMKKIQHISDGQKRMRGEKGKEVVLERNEGGGARNREKPNDLVNKGKEKVDDEMIRSPQAEGAQNKRNIAARHVVRQSGGPIPAKKKEKIINGSENIKKRGRGRPRKVQTKPGTE